MKYALSAFSITIAAVLIVAAVFPFFQKPAPEHESSKNSEPQSRTSRIKRFLKTSASLFPSRGPSSVGPFAYAEDSGGTLASIKSSEKNQLRNTAEKIDELEAAWAELNISRGHEPAAERAAMIHLCKQNFTFACDRYYRQEKSRYFEALEKARSSAAGPAREESLAKLKQVRGHLDQFAKTNCLGGNPFVCQDVIDQRGDGEMMNIIKSYCLGGGIDYCMTAGFALLNRWTRGQKQAKNSEGRSPQLEVVLDEAKTFMAKGCQAGSLEACSELIQGPLAEMTDPRTESAIEFFENLCNKGDPSACVAVAGALYTGNRQEVAEAVSHYCELRARPTELKLNDEERSLCSRLSKDKTVDDALWAEMLGLMYEGPRLSARVLDHLAPGRNVASP